MQLPLRLELGSGQHVGDVLVHASDDHRIDEVVAAALASLPGAADLTDPNLGRSIARRDASGVVRPLSSTASVREAGLIAGDALIVGTGPVDPASGLVGLRLVVTSGPDAGLAVELPPGQHVVGRSQSALLTLNDPRVSRQQMTLTVSADGSHVAVAPHPEASHQPRLDGRPVDGPTHWPLDVPLFVGETSLALRPPVTVRPAPRDRQNRIRFRRTPYFPGTVENEVIPAIEHLPTTPEPPRMPYLTALLPLAMGLVVAGVFGEVRFLLFALLSPLLAVGHHVDQVRRNRRELARSTKRFEGELAEQAEAVKRARIEERRLRHQLFPDVASLADRAAARSGELWIRDRTAEDFLQLRVGVGEQPCAVTVGDPARAEPEIKEQIAEALGPIDTLSDLPVTVNLADLGVVGLAGRSADTTALASSLVAQACCLHSPEDLVVVGVVAEQRGLDRWFRWLPHSNSPISPISGAHVATDPDDGNALLGAVVNASASAAAGGPTGQTGERTTNGPWMMVVVDQTLELDQALLSRLLDQAGPGGLSVVTLADGTEAVPRQAEAVVVCRPLGSTAPSLLGFTDPERPDVQLGIERLGLDAADRIARALAPVCDASSAGAAAVLPRRVPLNQTLGLETVDGAGVAQAWAAAALRSHSGGGRHALLAPIGAGEGGPLVVDLVAHGPHTLIGGTSGSGKSELLMSLVAGLIAHQPPTKVNLLFVDYKGGASSDVFRRAPHTVGYVTNLDGDRARRALVSLQAELNRRMALLQGKAKDLAEMAQRYPDEAPPALVIVVDEFATLVKEIPDFVAGVVDIAQRGRSLGIHLVLATQRPSGSVDENIKANTNLRIALRMLDTSESNAVIGAPDAANVPNPLRGRGYVRMGAGELTAFQSAWSGAPMDSATNGRLAVRAQPLSVMGSEGADGTASGSGEVDRASAGGASVGSERTQLDQLLDAVERASDQLGLGPGRAPWLDELPQEIPLADVRTAVGRERTEPGQVPIGMIDDPAQQRQYPAVLDLIGGGGCLVVGSGGSGKSTVLETIAASAALDAPTVGGSEMTVFVFDFASRRLVGLSRLAHCAGVATGDDIEALTRQLHVLDGELERRRQAVAEAISQGRAAPQQSPVFILIDGLEALLGLIEQSPPSAGLADSGAQLMRLLTEGRSVGLLPVATVSRLSAVRASVASAISNRIVLRQAEPQGYTDAGITAAEARDLDLKPGEAVLNGSSRLQVALPPADLADIPGRFDPHLRSAPLPRILEPCPQPVDGHPLRPYVGAADMTGNPVALDLRRDNLSIVGEPRSGRSTALAAIASQAARGGAEIWLVAPSWSPLAALADQLGVDEDHACLLDGEARGEKVVAMADRAGEAVRMASRSGATEQPRLLIVDDVDLFPEVDRALGDAVNRLMESLRWVAAGPKPRGFDPSPVAQAVRQARSLVYLQPQDQRDAFETLGSTPPWHAGLAMVPGRGIASVGRVSTIVQFSKPSGLQAQE